MTREDVIKLAETASLSLKESEIESFQEDLKKMIAFAEQLQSLATDQLSHESEDTGIYNVFRKDEVKPSMAKEELLANAPQEKNGFFFVPQIME